MYVKAPLKLLVSVSALAVVTGCWGTPSRDGKTLDQWVTLARDNSPETRRDAAKALGKLGLQSEDVVPALVDLAKDENRGVQMQAIISLRGISPSPRAKAALPALTEIALDVHQDFTVRKAAAKTAKVLQRQP
jgi:HEAT repeat protein